MSFHIKRFLITGATGNLRSEIIKDLFRTNNFNHIFAGVRDINRAKKIFSSYSNIDYIEFDFENPNTFIK